MKKNKLIFTLGALLLTTMLYSQSILKWAYEDGNGDGVWNWSYTSDSFASTNQWGDIPLSSEEMFEGETSLKFHYISNNPESPRAEAHVTTGYGDNGVEARDEAEKYASKDLSAYRYLLFYIKGDAHSVVKVSLQDPNGHSATNELLVSDFGRITPYDWHLIRIPLHKFSYQHDFTSYSVYSVNFVVPPGETTEDFTFYIDNLGFQEFETNPDWVNWFTFDSNNDGALNYGSIENYNGSNINGTEKWNDIPGNERYIGPPPSSFHDVDVLSFFITHEENGSAYAHITTGQNNKGLEARSHEEANAGRYVSYDRNLTFTLFGWSAGAKIKLVDKWGNSSTPVTIEDYQSSYGRYGYAVNIPCWAFFEERLDIRNIVSITVFVDETVPAGTKIFDLGRIVFR